MPLEELMLRPVVGINPFDELPINADVWRTAHNHHHLHRYLHALSAHRPGIVFGLEVIAAENKDRSLMVAPGIAIDGEGRTIVVREPETFTLEEAGLIYITLSFQRQADRQSGLSVGGGQQFFRDVEGRDLIHTKELPGKPHLELARIFRSKPDAPVRDAANPFAPVGDEIDLLNRMTAFPHCYADAGMGELAYVPKGGKWNPNRAGLWNLLREGNGSGFHLQFTNVLKLRGYTPGPADPALLYVAGAQGFGKSLSDDEQGNLKRYLDSGGLLFGEAAGGSEEFAKDFTALASALGASLKPVPAKHPLLTAHHVFSAPPPGGRADGKLAVDADAGILFSTLDYGAAWQGEIDGGDAATSRERIRQAQEFGLNLIAYAAGRRRRLALTRAAA